MRRGTCSRLVGEMGEGIICRVIEDAFLHGMCKQLTYRSGLTDLVMGKTKFSCPKRAGEDLFSHFFESVFNLWHLVNQHLTRQTIVLLLWEKRGVAVPEKPILYNQD